MPIESAKVFIFGQIAKTVAKSFYPRSDRKDRGGSLLSSTKQGEKSRTLPVFRNRNLNLFFNLPCSYGMAGGLVLCERASVSFGISGCPSSLWFPPVGV